MRTEALFDLSHTITADYLRGFEYPWEAIPGICDLVRRIGKTLDPEEYRQVSDSVWVHKTASLFSSAILTGPVIIGPRTHVYHCAVVRNGVIVGADCSIGSNVEIKNSILFDGAEVAHFNYIGDSIIGACAHFGAGSVVSNVKVDRSNIVIHENQGIETGSWKLGALVGDHVEIGCNTVLNPGTIVGRDTFIYPCMSVRGTIPSDSILKTGGVLVDRI